MGGSSGGSRNSGSNDPGVMPEWVQAPDPSSPLPPISTPVGATPTLPGQQGPATSPGNPFSGYALPQQVSGGFTNAMGGYSDLAQQGQNLGQGGVGNLNQAQQYYQQMAGMSPQDVQAGQMSNTDLNPYMNPYQRDVIDTTMQEMNRQHGIRQQGVDDAAAAQNAFGGMRHGVQSAQADRAFGDQQARTLAQLNTANFQNAQNQGQFDIGNQMQADRANQAMRSGMLSGGATGLGNLAQMGATLGGQYQQEGYGGLRDMANMGFGFGQDLQKNDMIMGQYQQQLNQQLMDAIKRQYQGFAGQGTTGLEVLSGGNKLGQSAGGTTTTNQQNNPGALGYLSGILGIAGMM